MAIQAQDSWSGVTSPADARGSDFPVSGPLGPVGSGVAKDVLTPCVDSPGSIQGDRDKPCVWGSEASVGAVTTNTGETGTAIDNGGNSVDLQTGYATFRDGSITKR